MGSPPAQRAATGTPTEAPQYGSLAGLIHRATAEALRLFGALRQQFFRAMGVPQLAAEFQVDTATLDAAIERYLTAMAGPVRTARGFLEGEGFIQQLNGAGWQVGAERGATLVHAESSPLTDAIRRHLNEEAFGRLSENGQLKFAGRLDAIRDRLVAASDAGENPVAVARELSRSLGLEQARLETLTRTETAIASEAGIRDEFRAAGVERVEVIGDPGTDELCVSHIGNVYPIDLEDELPPYHPNCLCSTLPVLDQSG